MKGFVLAALAALTLLPMTVSAQTRVAIGNIAKVEDTSPILWGQSGMDLFMIKRSDQGFTPIMRAETYDARTVEILSRTQAPRLTAGDVHTMSSNGHVYILVRQYLLLEVMPQDAAAEHTSKEAIASKWASAVRHVFPQVAPQPSKFGI